MRMLCAFYLTLLTEEVNLCIIMYIQSVITGHNCMLAQLALVAGQTCYNCLHVSLYFLSL